jgi:hypothetical protein
MKDERGEYVISPPMEMVYRLSIDASNPASRIPALTRGPEVDPLALKDAEGKYLNEIIWRLQFGLMQGQPAGNSSAPTPHISEFVKACENLKAEVETEKRTLGVS